MLRVRLSIVRACAEVLALCVVAAGVLAPRAAYAQVAGPNVNVISGTSLPDGDPYLQRQNESTGGVSTRNPLHLLAGANDYRTVDIPIDVGTQEESNGDAWLGLFKSYDGGQTWHTSLLPGYPQDTSAVGLASPLHGFAAGADPTVRAGTNGLFYYSGLAFNRGKNGLGVVFVARLIDNNNDKAKFDKNGKFLSNDPIAYLDAKVIDSGTAGQFADKPWLAVDIPRAGAGNCTITSGGTTQTIKAGNVYVSYIVSVGNDKNPVTRMMVARSTDCGVTWTKAVKVSERVHISQGSTLAIDPRNGTLYVAWREIGDKGSPDGILIVKSTDGGKTFTPAQTVTQILPFDQGGSEFTFRTRAFPTMAVDGTGRVYLAWTQRGVGPIPTPPPGGIVPPAGLPLGDARIMLKTSPDGVTWTQARPIDSSPLPGHQIQPVLNATAGKITATFYDFRDDVSGLFEPYISDANISSRSPNHKRHTMDVRVWQADPGAAPAIGSSAKVSQYLTGFRPPTAQNPHPTKEQLQYNAPNLPLYGQGKIAFVGDYMDLFGLNFITDPTGQTWKFNSDAGGPSATYAIWTDNRDVRPPKNGDWANYTRATPGAAVPDAFKSPGAPACVAGQTGMRNANIYTSRITPGLYVGAPVNTKKDHGIQRSFVVFVQNTSDDMKTFRLTAPAGTSWLQFDPLATVDVTVAPRSTTSRTLYIASATGPMQVTIVELDLRPKGSPNPTNPKSGGLTASVVLNPDVTNPDVTNPDVTNVEVFNPDVTNPDVTNPDVTNFSATNPDVTNSNIRNPDVTNPDVTNPDVTNPDVTNPDVTNVSIANPDVTNPDVTNPDVTNPDVTNPDVTNPDVTNQSVTNPSLTDVTWTVTNNGTTAGSFAVKPFVTKNAPQGFLKQLILHKSYKTPVTTNLGKAALNDCLVYTQVTNVLLANIVAPDVTNPDVTNPDVTNPDVTNPDVTNLVTNPDVTNASIWLEPGDSAKITMRVLNPDKTTNPVATKTITQSNGNKQIVEVSPQFEAAKSATPLVASVAVDTNGEEGDISFEAPLVVVTQFLPDAVATTPYLTSQAGAVTLQAAGGVEGARTWCVLAPGAIPDGTCPASPMQPAPGLTLNPATGVISGIPTTAGAFPFTVQVHDSSLPTPHFNTQDLFLRVAPFAVTDSKLTDEDAPPGGSLTFPATDLLANDPPLTANATTTSLVVTSVTATATTHGTVSLANGQITYTPQANYNGPADFRYTARLMTAYDGACCYPLLPPPPPQSPPALYPILTATGTVALNIVDAVNDAPIPATDSYSTFENTQLTTPAPGVLANDLNGPIAPAGTQDDESGQTLTAAVVVGPAHGQLTLNPDGSFSYNPVASYNGPDSFTYRACDNGLSHGSSDPMCANGTVNLTVVDFNDPPAAVDDVRGPIAEDSPLNFASATLTTNDSTGPPNESAQTLTVTSVAATANTHGTVVLNGNGTITYAPASEYNGPASFTYTVTDNGTTSGQPDPKSATGTVSLTVTEVNDAPVPTTDAQTTAEDTALNFAAATLTSNDAAGPANESTQTLTVTAVGSASHGTLGLASGTITYTPAPNYNGPDSFTYTVGDNGTTNGGSDPKNATGTVNIAVTSVNDAPSFTKGADQSVANSAGARTVANWATNLSVGPANESGQVLNFIVSNNNPTLFSVQPAIGATGTLTFTPAPAGNGSAIVTAQIHDNGGIASGGVDTSPAQTFTIAVIGASSDLSITKTHGPNATPSTGQAFTYTLSVLNSGPDTAPNVTVTDPLPASLTFGSATPSQGNCNQASGTVTCDLGTLANGATATIAIVVTPTQAKPITNTATVSSPAATDTNLANNTASDSTIVGYGPCAVPTFSFYIPGDVSATATLLATGDFNKDGYLDVAVSDGTFGYVRVFLADVTNPGSYNHTDYATGTGAPNGIVVRDFDGDGNLDMAVAVSAGVNSNIALFKGTASGAFPVNPLTTIVAAGPQFPDAADFSGDGRPDVVVGNTASTTISILVWNSTAGNFNGPVAVQSGPSSGLNLIIEDFDGNGTLDIATPNIGANSFTILSGNGNGTFAAPATIALPSPILRLRKVGDIFGDGKPDLGATLTVTSTAGLSNLALLRNTSTPGAFSFAAPVEILSESYGIGLFAAADVTGDGNPDLVAISGQLATSNTTASVLVLPGDGTGSFGAPAQYQNGRQNNFEIVDLNGDGKLDVIGVGPFSDTFYILQNACGTATTSDLSLTMSGPATVAAGNPATYTVTVTNNGPDPANGVFLLDYFGTDSLVRPAGTPLDQPFVPPSSPPNAFLCFNQDPNFGCLLAAGFDQQTGEPLFTPLAPGASASFDVDLKVFSGAHTNRATVTSFEADPNNANNIASATTTAAAAALTFVVTNTNEDRDDPAGSLRQAIRESNANVGPAGSPNTITFNIPGAGPTFTIAPTTVTPLPNITTPVVIDGTTQQAFMGAPCTNPAVACPPIIELTGTTAGGQGGNGLTITTSGSTVRGLVLNRWGNAAILLNNSTVGANVIAGNYIGTTVTGNAAPTPVNLRGIQVQSPNTIIGGTTAADRNVISGNGANGGIFVGAQLNGTTVVTSGAGTIIRGNYIGVGADGTTAIINGTGNVGGINVQAPNVTIGGTTVGARNVIAMNFGSGILVGAQNQAGTTTVLSNGAGTVIQGNWVGLKADGSGTNGLNNTTGIDVRAPNVVVGGTAPGAGNVISATTSGAGIAVTASTVAINGVPTAFTTGSGTIIQGNYIGTNPAGSAAGAGNMSNGVTVNVPNVTIGGASPPPPTLGTTGGAGNVISGNGSNGISGSAFVSGTTVVTVPSGMVVQGNYVGTNASGTAQVANTGTGINASGANSVITGNVASGNTVNGISIAVQTISGTTTVSSAGTGSIVQGNYVGVKADGSGPLPNGSIGVTAGAPATIGGTAAGAGNVISGNTGSGISIGVTTATVSGVTSVVSTGAGTIIQGNYIGTNPAGNAAMGNGGATGSGVSIQVPNVTVGGGTAGARNVISGNPTGVNINLSTTGLSPNTVVLSYGTSAIVQGNYIGTNATSSAAIPNTTGISVQAYGAHIGGTTALERNVIAGNSTGIQLTFNTINGGVLATIGSGALIEGNYIGVDASGNGPLANTSTGISVATGTANLPASAADPTNMIAGNVIARSVTGISISSGTTSGKAVVTGNFIGTNAASAAGLGNTGNGISISSGNNQIGGTCSDTFSPCAARNIISGNGNNGISIGTVSGNLILGNYIGLGTDGTAIVSNSFNGIDLAGSNNTIGPNNVISGNLRAGVLFSASTASNNTVKGNFIGTDNTGTLAKGNGIGTNNAGVTITAGTGNTIGGVNFADRNIISANVANGVSLQGGVGGNFVINNFIGTTANGTAGTPTLGNGFGVSATSASIRVDTANNSIIGNVIAGGFATGININSSGTIVQGNKVGTNSAGTSAVPNATEGINVAGSNNTIGGVGPGDGNLISGNTLRGLFLIGNNNIAQGNLIGTNAAGTAALSNKWFGIQINGNNNTVGGTAAGARNVISGNGFDTATRSGIAFFSTASGNLVQGNYLGTDINGTAGIGNAAEGIFVAGTTSNATPVNNVLGGLAAGAGNVIAFNNSNGVTLMPGNGTGNTIRGNSIFSNTGGPGLGIDVGGGGVTNNDLGDADTGPNNFQNYPVLSSAPIASGTVTFNGTLNSIASATFDLDFYANASCDPSTFGEGKSWLGTAQVVTDNTGNVTFSLPFTYPGSGDAFTATATDAAGNTSEFSKCVYSSALVITTTSLPQGYQGTPYSTSLAATGGTGIYTWSLALGSLPSGLTLHPNGVIDGTPTTATPAATFDVMVADSTGQMATKTLSLVVQPLTVNTTTSLNAGRGGHTSTVLADGKVLVAGGSDASGYLASAEIYDPAADTWTAVNSMSAARGNHVAVRLEDGQVLVTGGNTSGGLFLASAEIFDPSTGSWTPTSNGLSVARAKPAAVTLNNGRVLVAGGTDGSVHHASADIFDPDSGTWSSTGSMSRGRYAPAMTMLPNGHALIVGGSDGSAVLSSEEFDPANGTWGQVASTSGGHQFTQAITLADGRTLVAGGFNGLAADSTAEVYVSGSGWLPINGLNVARHDNPLVVRQDGQVVVAGGSGGSGVTASVETYNPTSGSGLWQQVGSLVTARKEHTAVRLQTAQILITGGFGTSALAIASSELMGVNSPAALTLTVGGLGGHAYRYDCLPTTVATGLRGYVSFYPDRTELWCGSYTPSLGPDIFAGGGGPSNTSGTVSYNMSCSAGQIMVGLHGTAGNVGWGTIVSSIGIDCQDPAHLSDGTPSTPVGPVGSAFTPPFSLACPVGQAVVGIYGGQGTVLDRVGLVCRVP